MHHIVQLICKRDAINTESKNFLFYILYTVIISILILVLCAQWQLYQENSIIRRKFHFDY